MDKIQNFSQALLIIFTIYILVDRKLQKKSWADLGFRKDLIAGLKKSWYLVLIVVLFLQIIPPIIAKYYFPELISHIVERIPNINDLPLLVFIVIISTLVEELVFRVYIQGKLSLIVGNTFAILITSALFAVSHITGGSTVVFLFDIGLVFLDGIVYGTIYLKSGNVLAAWLTHLSADLVGLVMLLTIFPN